jgi:hypothetical protein
MAAVSPERCTEKCMEVTEDEVIGVEPWRL